MAGRARRSSTGGRPGTRDRDQAIAMALGDLARQIRTATDGHAEEPHERA
jgi:hypothetical protein